MSTVLKTKGENLYQNIYFTSWRLMSISDQKSIQLIMQYAVLPKQLSTGMKFLNMETFVEVCLYCKMVQLFENKVIFSDLQINLFILDAPRELKISFLFKKS